MPFGTVNPNNTLIRIAQALTGFVLFGATLSYGLMTSYSGSSSLRDQITYLQELNRTASNNDFTPRPATLTRVYSEPQLFGLYTTHFARTSSGETVTLRSYSGEQPGDQVCTVRRQGHLEQTNCP